MIYDSHQRTGAAVFRLPDGHHELLKRLGQSSEPANVSKFARELKVSWRTMARDLQELVNHG